MARRFTNKQFKKLEDMLKEYSFMKGMIVQDETTLQEFYGLKGIDYDKVTVNPTNKFNSDTENQLLSKIEIENRMNSNKEIIRRIDSALSMLSTENRRIIEDYYINDIGWVSIERRLNSSIRRCQRKRDLAMIRMWEYLYGERVDKKSGHAQLKLMI